MTTEKSEWERMFAWLPVELESGDLAWMRHVERRTVSEYRTPSKYNVHPSDSQKGLKVRPEFREIPPDPQPAKSLSGFRQSKAESKGEPSSIATNSTPARTRPRP